MIFIGERGLYLTESENYVKYYEHNLDTYWYYNAKSFGLEDLEKRKRI